MKRPFDILILGGGFSGTMLAIQLLRRDPRLNVAVVDKGKTPGRGLAYSTYYRFHVLNVSVKNMSALRSTSSTGRVTITTRKSRVKVSFRARCTDATSTRCSWRPCRDAGKI